MSFVCLGGQKDHQGLVKHSGEMKRHQRPLKRRRYNIYGINRKQQKTRITTKKQD